MVRWPSARAHCGLCSGDLLADDSPPAGVVAGWRAWLRDEDQVGSAAVRRNMYTGRPCGSLSYVERVEGLLKRALRLQKAGRKRTRRADEGKGLFNGQSVPSFTSFTWRASPGMEELNIGHAIIARAVFTGLREDEGADWLTAVSGVA